MGSLYGGAMCVVRSIFRAVFGECPHSMRKRDVTRMAEASLISCLTAITCRLECKKYGSLELWKFGSVEVLKC